MCIQSQSGRHIRAQAGHGFMYPSSGEAEYIADLALAMAVALSWWAIRNGRAKLRVPRAPVAQEAGNRVGWTDRPSRSCAAGSWRQQRSGLAWSHRRPGQGSGSPKKIPLKSHAGGSTSPPRTLQVAQSTSARRKAAAGALARSGHRRSCPDSMAPRPSVSQSTCCGFAPRRS